LKATIAGVATRVGESAVELNRYGDLVGAHSYKSISLELPAAGVIIDCDHDEQRVGELTYAELRDDGALCCVAVLDNDRLTEIEEDVFYSPKVELRGDVNQPFCIAREARLLGLSITFNPATLCAQPIEIRSGDLRSSADRGKWSTSWRWHSPLLSRALDFLDAGYGIEKRAARIVDVAAEAEEARAQAEWEREQRWLEARPAPQDKYRLAWDRHGVGARIEWSRHPGRILSVR
jgi:hypothetical protein